MSRSRKRRITDAYVKDNRREIWGTGPIRAFMAQEFVGDHVTMDVREVIDHYGDIIVRARYDPPALQWPAAAHDTE